MAAGRRQAHLETRGPGVLGKWEEQFFRLEDGRLESFPMDGSSGDQPLRSILVHRIEGLAMEPGSRECSFVVDGLKVRLRADSEQEAHGWFVALQTAQVPVPASVTRASDLFVQIAGIFGLPPSADAAVESKWYTVLHWQKETSRHSTKEKAAVQDTSSHCAACPLKQTVRLRRAPSNQTLLVGVYRVATGIGGSQRFGECALDADDRNNHKMADHPIAFADGRLTGAVLRMRLRCADQDRALGAGHLGAPTPGAASSRASPASVDKAPAVAAQDPTSAVWPSTAPSPAAPRSPSLKSDHGAQDTPSQTPRSTRGRRCCVSQSPDAGAEDDVKLVLTDSLALTPSSGGGTAATTPASRQVKPHRANAKADQLYEDYALKQHKLEMLRVAREEEDRRRIRESREALLKRSRRNWAQAELDPQKAADRLFRDHKARSRELAQLQQRYEEEERQQLEERRFHKKGLVRSQSAPGHVSVKEVGERLHKDQERREQEAQRRREEREAYLQQELEKSSSGPYRRCLTARGETKRHEELYTYAAIQREVLDRKRRERQEAEMRKQNENMVGKSTPVDTKRIERLFRDHQEREQKRAFKKAEQQTRELQQIESDLKRLQRRKPSPWGSSGQAALVTVAFELLSLDCGLLLTDQALLEQFQTAISAAVAEEAGHNISPESVYIDFQEGSGPESSVVVQAIVNAPSSNVASSVHAVLSSATSLGASVVGRLASLDYVGTVSQGVISVSDRGVTVAQTPQQDRQRGLPIWQRSAVQGRKDEPQEPPHVAVFDPATQADIVLNAVVSAISSRCYFDRTSPAAELKWLGAPLRAAMGILKDALSCSEKAEGFLRLSALPSHRIFFDGHLLPEEDGFRSCVEPSPIRQVEENLEVLLAHAAEAQVILGEMLAPSPTSTPGAWEPRTSRSKPSGVPTAMLAYNPGTKPRGSTDLKVAVRYQTSDRGRATRHLLDLARFGLVFANAHLLQKGLETIIKKFEVLSVRNRYNTPGRLGHRLVEVYLCVEVDRGDTKVPHVCELRLEEMAFESVRAEADAQLEVFYQRLNSVFSHNQRDSSAIAYLAHSLLVGAPESRSLRSFRCRLAKHYGSTITSWRRNFAAGRQLSFGRFRDVCREMKCRKEAPELWSQLDPGMSGCISLFELDPDAVALLVHIRSRIMMVVNTDEADSEELFRRLTSQLIPAKPGQLDIAEFRQVLRNFGFGIEIADRAFTCLDYEGGNCKPPASVSSSDFAWLLRLPLLVDIDAVMLNSKTQLNVLDSLRYLLNHKGGGSCTSGTSDGLATPSSSAGAGIERRARSQEPAGKPHSGATRQAAARDHSPGRRPLSASPVRTAKQGTRPGPQTVQRHEELVVDHQACEDPQDDGEHWDIYQGRTPDDSFLEECF